jgi:hypothetical protein
MKKKTKNKNRKKKRKKQRQDKSMQRKPSQHAIDLSNVILSLDKSFKPVYIPKPSH